MSRRGIPIQPKQKPWWQSIFSLNDFSLVIDFPSPVTSVILELHENHELEYFAHNPGGTLVDTGAVPQGEAPQLDFPVPVEQVRFMGEAFLYAIRIPDGAQGFQQLSVVPPPVQFVDAVRPEPPVLATIDNLQQTQPQPTPSNMPSDTPPTRPALGFEVKWRPALRDGLTLWPSDADAAPPLEAALFEIEHQEVVSSLLPKTAETSESSSENTTLQTSTKLGTQTFQANRFSTQSDSLIRAVPTETTTTDSEKTISIETGTAWTPVLPEENWTVGNRTERKFPKRIRRGVDAMEVFPEAPRRGNGGSLDLKWRDVFDFSEGGQTVVRPVPTPGTYHKYRVRAVDPVGRASLTWTETNELRLEKRVPPPIPAGPDQTPADTLSLPAPSGVQAKVIVKDAPGLTPDDLAILGTDDNVVVLRWGWHAAQREQDAFAAEFRVYVADKPLDTVTGTLTAFNELSPGEYEATIELERPVVDNAAKDAPLEAGYAFVVLSHTAGQTITATLSTRVEDENGNFRQPAIGPVELYTHMTPDLTRPPTWSERFAVEPITTATTYQAVIRNRLTLTPESPRDSIWVGVSSADDQDYVPDQLAPAESRPGNESAIVPVRCEARYHGRPIFDVPPALDPVPVYLTPEPTDKAIQFTLDLTPYLTATGLTSGNRIRPERVSAEEVFTAYGVTLDNRIMAKAVDPQDASETDVEVTIPNPDDRAAVIEALNGGSVEALEDRFVRFLAGSHPYRDRLFVPAVPDPIPLGPFAESLPQQGGRYIYRVRKADAVGHLSAGGAVAEVVVRVPSQTPGAPPTQAQRHEGDAPETLRIQIGPDPSVTYLLTFSQVVSSNAAPSGEATLLRVPNRPDLYPNNGIRLRTSDGMFLAPQVKSLSDADVQSDEDGFRHMSLDFSAAFGEKVRVWACSITRDGALSALRGPWALMMPPVPLPVPNLTATAAGANVNFAWTWGATNGLVLEVALERSGDGNSWSRFSAYLPQTTTSYTYTPPPGTWQYRIMVTTPTGRIAYSNPVTPA